jgi:uncharacterized protein
MNTNFSTKTAGKSQVDASTLFLAKVFNWMAIGLGMTAVTSFMVIQSGIVFSLINNTILFFGMILAELGMVFYLSARIAKMSAGAATGLFLMYSVLNGVTLSAILLRYTATSVVSTFVITSAMFGAMAVYGFVTKKDLSSWGSFLFMGLIGMIIASVVNIFIGSSMMSWIISAIGVLVFTGLTAYDVQKISQFGAMGIMDSGQAAIRKGVILGALSLYLDFVNLFISLLHLLGGRD